MAHEHPNWITDQWKKVALVRNHVFFNIMWMAWVHVHGFAGTRMHLGHYHVCWVYNSVQVVVLITIIHVMRQHCNEMLVLFTSLVGGFNVMADLCI